MNARNASFFGCYALCLKKWLTGLVWLDNYAWLFYCWCLMYAFACICVCIWCCWRLEYVCVCWWSKKVKLGSGLLCLKLNVENASVVNHFSYKIKTDSKMLSLFFFFFLVLLCWFCCLEFNLVEFLIRIKNIFGYVQFY